MTETADFVQSATPGSMNYQRTTQPNAETEGPADAIRIEDLQVAGCPTDLAEGKVPSAAHRIGPFSATVPQGGFHIVTGSNGSGKSALIAVLALAAPPVAGRLWILGHEISRRSPQSRSGIAADRATRKALRRRIGGVFQHLTPLPGATVLETVLLPASIIEERATPPAATTRKRGEAWDGTAPENPEAAARELLHWVGLAGRDQDQADSLSGGESRCLALARALIRRPEILIADDPTRGLDERAAWRMMGLIEQLHRQGTTIIVATNDPAFLQAQSHPVTDLGGRGRRTVRSAKA